jgi:hypothetical protein
MTLSNPPNNFKRQGIDKVWPPKNLKRQGILNEEDQNLAAQETQKTRHSFRGRQTLATQEAQRTKNPCWGRQNLATQEAQKIRILIEEHKIWPTKEAQKICNTKKAGNILQAKSV